MAARVRDLAMPKGFNASTLGEALGVPSSSAANYWSGKRAWPTEVVPDLAEKLATNVEYLMVGGPKIVAPPPASSRRDDLVEIAEIDPRFGLGAVVMDEPPAPEMRSFSRAWLRQITPSEPEELYWARGKGNSMAPTIGAGELVLIDRSDRTLSDTDCIWAFAWGHVGAIKRLRPTPDGTVKILSDNPTVPPDEASWEDIQILGRVVAVVKRL